MTSAATGAARNGKIVTFYSYKGGTGRSMALANVAWLLANAGQRVLAIDWDLEAPGLHRFFEPFLQDKSLQQSTGLIDFVLEFATAAVSQGREGHDPDWYLPHSNILAHATSVAWDFPDGGMLDFVPAGRQDAAYSSRVNSFNWQNFYERLGGGVLLESVKRTVRGVYDFVLIDSRTGVSDTSGVCTVQMPDELVVCFTLNRQSIYGASAAANSAFTQRTANDGRPTLKVWPVPMRIEPFEKDQHDVAQTLARTRFSGLMPHLNPQRLENYWGDIGVHYEPYYAYEELLAPFKDRPRQTTSLLARMERIASYLGEQTRVVPAAMNEELRNQGLTAFTTRSAWDYMEELGLLANEYDRIRMCLPPGNPRTELMNLLVSRAQVLSGNRDAGLAAEELFRRGTDGCRVVALALARKEPRRHHVELALAGIAHSRSAFEQYHALLLTREIIGTLDPTAARQVNTAISGQIGRHIQDNDRSRYNLAQAILQSAAATSRQPAWSRHVDTVVSSIAAQQVPVLQCLPSNSFVRYDDVDEHHGPFVTTRGVHNVQLPPTFRICKHLVTNRVFAQFIHAGGYQDDSLWPIAANLRSRFVTADGTSAGPASWPAATAWPADHAEYPVSGVSYLEAQAFARWSNQVSADPQYTWALPQEDLWEFAARGEAGLIYPWGDVFDKRNCNSAESGMGGPTEVMRYTTGVSPLGCYDMAGNLWEFVVAGDAEPELCVLRGGSYKNDSAEMRSYLRLIRVPVWHRAPDFGFRLVQVQDANLANL